MAKPRMTDEDRAKYEQIRTEMYEKIDSRTDLTEEQRDAQKEEVDARIAEHQEEHFDTSDEQDAGDNGDNGDEDEMDGMDGRSHEIDDDELEL